jgi:hypothetical protein
MNEIENRAMKDRHSREEAALREAQQASAGASRPVEPYPPHGGAASREGEHLPTRVELVRLYETALAREQAAWLQVRGSSEPAAASWDSWRAAVEERDKATRLLINDVLSASALQK